MFITNNPDCIPRLVRYTRGPNISIFEKVSISPTVLPNLKKSQFAGFGLSNAGKTSIWLVAWGICVISHKDCCMRSSDT